MAAATVDIALIGAGCAGLSLALRLARGGYAGRVLLVEPRTENLEDRTWCGWSDGSHPFAAARERRWLTWAVSGGGTEILRSESARPYEMLRAQRVYAIGWEAVATRPDWAVRRGRRLAALEPADGQVRLLLDDGEPFVARWVLDARPPARELSRPWVWQAFAGVELDEAPALDPEVVRLMDFLPDSRPLLTFSYQLPIARHRRLVELTRFTARPPARERLEAELAGLCQRLGVASATILRREYGCLPMAPPLPQPGQRHLRIGAAGGSLRPATGYAFHAIQRWADDCAQRLLAGEAPCPPARRAALEWMDRVYLESLWRDPAQAPARFLRLFGDTEPAALTRFLMGEPRLRDLGCVVRSLPLAPLLGAAATAHRRIGRAA